MVLRSGLRVSGFRFVKLNVSLLIFFIIFSSIHSFRLQIPKIIFTKYNSLYMSTKATTSISYANSAEPDLSLAPSSVINGATVLKCDKITKSFTGTPQFDEVSFTLGKGQRVGLIGINGAGKSTFLKCLARVDAPDAGTVEVMSNANVVFVEQDPRRDDAYVFEVLFGETTPRGAAARLYMAAGDPLEVDPDTALLNAIESMNDGNAWEYQEKGIGFAEKLNIASSDMYRRMGSLSGGQKKRVALAAALLLEPDVLLLDEPTNHLDIDALDWLAEYLRPGGSRDNKEMAVLIVTHDRFFLERVCSEIVELDRGSIFRYPCNYGKYLEMKAARMAAEDAETDRARTKLRRESEWMARQPKARQAKSRARENAFYELVDKAKGRTPDSKALELASPEEKAKQKRLGGVVAKFRNAGFTLKNEETGGSLRLLQDFTYDFRQRDRIGIVGPNGVGKSTFLKVLTGQLALESGTVEVGETVKIGWYDQIGLNLTPEQEKMPVLRFVQEECERADSSERKFSSGDNAPKIAVKVEDVSSMGRRNRLAGKEVGVEVFVVSNSGASTAFSERDAMALLSRFQFPSKRWYDRIGQLSGGERRRLQLLQILASKPNVLLLDEPSNDLDLSTLSALEEYLTEVFEGCLVVVSHDNFFVNRVAEHLFVFQGDGIVRDFQGSYADYLDYRTESLIAEKQALKKKDPVVVTTATSTVKSITTESSNKQSQNSNNNNNNNNNKDSKKQSSTSTSTSTTTQPATKSTQTKGRELTYNERKDMNKLEKDIQKLQQQVNTLESKLSEESNKKVGFTVLNELSTDINKLKVKIDAKEIQWMVYAEIDEST